jgi:hypothetical protein
MRLIGTCNVLSADSALASPCVEKCYADKKDEHLERSAIFGLAKARVFKESKEMVGRQRSVLPILDSR